MRWMDTRRQLHEVRTYIGNLARADNWNDVDMAALAVIIPQEIVGQCGALRTFRSPNVSIGRPEFGTVP